jgi:hypothetical protein
VFSREHCAQALVRHPDEGVYLVKFPGKLAPGIARIGAAEDLTVDATGQQKIGVGSVRIGASSHRLANSVRSISTSIFISTLGNQEQLAANVPWSLAKEF